MVPEPVPFHLPMPGRDSLGFDGARSVSFRIHGLLHFDGDTVTIEWSTTRHLEQVTLTRVRVEDDATPPELVDIAVEWIADARVTGGWWAPRLILRARRLDAFAEVPGAQPGSLSLPILRRDRAIAAAMAAALTAASPRPALSGSDPDSSTAG